LAQAEEDLSSNAEGVARAQQQLAGLKQQTATAQAGLADAQAALARVKQQVQVRTMFATYISVYHACTSV
jgi:multidrug resistance efflux pump